MVEQNIFGKTNGVRHMVDELVYVGIGVFVLVVILGLSFQGYSSAANAISQSYGTTSGVFQNFTKVAGPLPNTFDSSLELMIFALMFIAVLLGIFGALTKMPFGILDDKTPAHAWPVKPTSTLKEMRVAVKERRHQKHLERIKRRKERRAMIMAIRNPFNFKFNLGKGKDYGDVVNENYGDSVSG